MRGLQAACAQDNLLPLHGEHFAVALYGHADRPFTVKHHPLCQHVGPNGQVEAMANRIEMGQRGAHSDVVGIVDW